MRFLTTPNHPIYYFSKIHNNIFYVNFAFNIISLMALDKYPILLIHGFIQQHSSYFSLVKYTYYGGYVK